MSTEHPHTPDRLANLGFEPLIPGQLYGGAGALVSPERSRDSIYVPFDNSIMPDDHIRSLQVAGTLHDKPHDGFVLHYYLNRPDHTAEGAREVFIERTPEGYGGSMRANTTPAEQLKVRARVPLKDQLFDQGFQLEAETEDVSVHRLRHPAVDIVAALRHSQLYGLFVPLEMHRSVPQPLILEDLVVKGITSVQRPALTPQEPNPAIVVANSWFTTTMSPKVPSDLNQTRIHHWPTTTQLGMELPEPETRGGFVHNGMNTTEAILNTQEINGVHVAVLSTRMRPGSYSTAGFMGQKEDLRTIMATDNDTVLGFGTTHQALAKPLLETATMVDNCLFADGPVDIKKAPGNVIQFFEGPDAPRYFVSFDGWMGYQHSPFEDGLLTSRDTTITNLTSGHRLHFSNLLPHLIYRYGFYEGEGTSYRLSPQAITEAVSELRLPEFQETMKNDPIVKLTSGASEATLHTADHIARYHNLYSLKMPEIVDKAIVIEPASTDDLFSILWDKNMLYLARRISLRAAENLTPQAIALPEHQSFDTLLDHLAQLPLKLQYAITSLIASVDQKEGQTPEDILTATMRASLETEQAYSQHPLAAFIKRQAAEADPLDLVDTIDALARGNSYRDTRQGAYVLRDRSDQQLNYGAVHYLTGMLPKQLDHIIKTYADALQIPRLPKRFKSDHESIQTFFARYPHIPQGIAAQNSYAGSKRPDITHTQWVRIAYIVSGIQPDTETLRKADATFLQKLDLPFESIRAARRRYPNGTVATVVSQLYNGALERPR